MISWQYFIPERRFGAFQLLEAADYDLNLLSPAQIAAIRRCFHHNNSRSVSELLRVGELVPVPYDRQFISKLFADLRQHGIQNRRVFITFKRVIQAASPSQRQYLRTELEKLISDKAAFLSLFDEIPDSMVDIEEEGCSA